MANRIIDWIAGLEGWLLCLAVFALALGESAIGLDFVVPGEVGMVVGGAAGERAGIPLVVLIALATLGSVVGDQVSYQLGRRFGPSLAGRWKFTKKHVEPKLAGAREHFDRRGGATVFIARWVGALRAVVPFVAGTAKMPMGRFLFWDVLGALTWSATIVTLGYVLGRSIADAVDRFGALISVVVVAGLIAWFVVRRVRAKRRGGSDNREETRSSA
jgi:membrane protein DedA with SNARE-associated domain